MAKVPKQSHFPTFVFRQSGKWDGIGGMELGEVVKKREEPNLAETRKN